MGVGCPGVIVIFLESVSHYFPLLWDAVFYLQIPSYFVWPFYEQEHFRCYSKFLCGVTIETITPSKQVVFPDTFWNAWRRYPFLVWLESAFLETVGSGDRTQATRHLRLWCSGSCNIGNRTDCGTRWFVTKKKWESQRKMRQKMNQLFLFYR